MKEFLDRVSYWLGERFAVMEDRTEDAVVPPLDQTLERFAASCEALKQRFSLKDWRRG